jgi:hypothetical protein
VLHKHATDAALSARKLLETNGGGLRANNQLREQLIQSDTSFRTASSLRSAAFFSTLCVTIVQLVVVCCLVSVLQLFTLSALLLLCCCCYHSKISQI